MNDPSVLLSTEIDHLVRAAVAARLHAYVNYSRFPVGAALRGRSGRVYTGCNIENASYGLTVCAERVAIWKAVSEGETDFVALAVVTADGVAPCGACRQVMAEFSLEMPVIIADLEQVRRISSVAELLPGAFLPSDLLAGAG